MATGYSLTRRVEESYLLVGGKMQRVASVVQAPHAAVCGECLTAVPVDEVLR